MKCPACDRELTELQVGSLYVDVCQGGCGGIWFDAFELPRADDESVALEEPLLWIQRDDNVLVDPKRKRECPRCGGIKLHRHFFSARRGVEVDQCPNCAGYWLDAGELAQVREEKALVAREHQARQAAISPKVIQYLYKLERQEPKR